MEQNMQSLRPENLTNEELLKYTDLAGAEELTNEWLAELIKRAFNGWTAAPANVVDPRQLKLF
jgi:hypothetical protein